MTLIGDTERTRLLRRVLVGQDSFMMAEFMRERRLGHFRRYLDVGPGSGVVLLSVSPHADERVGLDINPRAVAVTRLNAELNRIECRVELEDVIANGASHGPFDLVTWNTPFVMLPPECKDTHYDGYGGELGMEVLFNFIQVLPRILAKGGRSFLAAAAPILKSGENLLEPELSKLAKSLGLDVVEHITQSYWHDLYREFHEARQIRRFEHSFLELSHGTGGFARAEAPLASRLSDRLRGLVRNTWRSSILHIPTKHYGPMLMAGVTCADSIGAKLHTTTRTDQAVPHEYLRGMNADISHAVCRMYQEVAVASASSSNQIQRCMGS